MTETIGRVARDWLTTLAILAGVVYGYGRLSQQIDSIHTRVDDGFASTAARLDVLDARLWELRGQPTTTAGLTCPADVTRVHLATYEWPIRNYEWSDE